MTSRIALVVLAATVRVAAAGTPTTAAATTVGLTYLTPLGSWPVLQQDDENLTSDSGCQWC